MTVYEVTKYFVEGLLVGLTHTSLTSVCFEVGKEYGGINGSKYRVVKITGIKI